MTLRIGSVCTGYGGLDEAVQQVYGGELVWVADNDPGAAAILAHHHPDVPNLGDITAVNWADVPPVDVLTMGFPCQDVSVAGQRAGEGDDRRDLQDCQCAAHEEEAARGSRAANEPRIEWFHDQCTAASMEARVTRLRNTQYVQPW